MNRRTFLAAAAGLTVFNEAQGDAEGSDISQPVLAGTGPLSESGDLAMRMVDSINEHLLRLTAESVSNRPALWGRDYGSPEKYQQSVAANREHLRKIIGAVDPRVHVSVDLDTTTSASALIASTDRYNVYAVRWPVFDDVTSEGLLLEPAKGAMARIVALPDADVSPEKLVGLDPGLEPNAQFARRLAENGCQVLVPVVIDRNDTWSGIPGIRMTNQPHREWIYRMAFEAGRHIIGYEVQKVLSAVDWFEYQNRTAPVPIGVMGHGEGGLLALHSAAIDIRIQSAVVSGYFDSRQDLWKEPIYRDLWAFLSEFGDAELASLIAPRTLIIEACHGPEVSGPPPETPDRKGAAPTGQLTTPALSSVRAEVERARTFYKTINADHNLQLVVSDGGKGLPGSEDTLKALLLACHIAGPVVKSEPLTRNSRGAVNNSSERMHRQFDELVTHTQAILRHSQRQRAEFWSRADASSPERWHQSTGFYRDYIWKEIIGQLPSPSMAVNARTRLVYDEPKFRGYEVLLDVWPGVFAYGILLLPKDLRSGERRPVVVCQHGLEGRPQDVADPKQDSHFYHHFAASLADEGFVTYAPQNPYIGHDRFRIIQRKGHPVKLSLFSFILGQHQRALEWLASLSFVDRQRIGFYGLSYGGKTAVRVPPLLDGYALSICSGDFNEWVWKTTSVDSSYSYMLTPEYDMLEFDFANVVNYSELADLMAPRPFMVERGHLDPVAPDEWVAYEYAKVRRFYDVNMNLPSATAIEFFTGPHTIHAEGTFEFLRKHLHWPPSPRTRQVRRTQG